MRTVRGLGACGMGHQARLATRIAASSPPRANPAASSLGPESRVHSRMPERVSRIRAPAKASDSRIQPTWPKCRVQRARARKYFYFSLLLILFRSESVYYFSKLQL